MWTRTFSAFTVGLILATALFVARPAAIYAAPENGSTAAAGTHAEGGEPNPLDWKADLALWSFIVFLILFGVLYKAAWGPLAEGLSKREKHITDQIAQANAANQQAK